MKIIFASRLVAYKNLDFIFAAISRLKERRLWPAGATFVVMGSGPEESRLLGLRSSLGIESDVEMLGSVSEERVLEETKTCDMALAPALSEFSPNYLLRAISVGKAFLVSTENGLSFPVPKQLSFDAGDERDFIDKLTWIFSHPKELKLILKSMPKLPDWSSVVSANVELIQNILKS